MSLIKISKVNGKWLINGKPYNEISNVEKVFFDEFILAMKWEMEAKDFDKRIAI